MGRIKWQEVQKGTINWQRVRGAPLSSSVCTGVRCRFSRQDWAWLLRVDRGTSRQWRDSAEPLVRSDKDGDMPLAVKIESNGQLQCIECPQGLRHSILHQ